MCAFLGCENWGGMSRETSSHKEGSWLFLNLVSLVRIRSLMAEPLGLDALDEVPKTSLGRDKRACSASQDCLSKKVWISMDRV